MIPMRPQCERWSVAMKCSYLIAVAVVGMTVAAQAQDLHSIAPPAILQMDSLPNAGELRVRYCLVGNHICTEHSTSCHGQCCSQYAADSIGYGCSGNVYGLISPLSHYAGWRCQMYAKPASDVPLGGDAGPVPENIKQCTNIR
jgi:hypothetical protein